MLKFSIVLLALLFSCSYQARKPAEDIRFVKDGEYDSEFPVLNTSKYLEQIIPSLKLISSLSFYKAYQFSLEDSVTKEQLDPQNIKQKALAEYIYERPSTGTATTIFHRKKELLFLTSNHIVYHPDTVLSYYALENRPSEPSRYIHTFSVKIKQTINVISVPRSAQPVILARDTENDLALVGVKLHKIPKTDLPVFKYPFGRASELHWGTFVYLIGFPQGKLLLASTVVSEPNRDDAHNFLINTTMNQGVSGGIILAMRDGPPNFELVGLATALSAQSQYFLRPDLKSKDPFIDLRRPYKGEIYIGQRLGSNPGIIFAISAEMIVRFIRRNIAEIRDNGYEIPDSFPSPADPALD
ncbi:MAG: trypsin-like peptidase domain-containing protein [Calditrichaeota bacterium]|nr:trypsin-like peptidase domain-containing protein [Calditrichota bacterium]